MIEQAIYSAKSIIMNNKIPSHILDGVQHLESLLSEVFLLLVKE